ncbi:MAG TPA: RNA polymerase sigma factor [Candidatus Limnocylindria bacterium]|nr:RNA polymerase sigma factor [Candidatus Limnocylindria bacterium]
MHLPPFETLIDAHATELHRFLVARVGPTEAEDCLQETFMSALRTYPRLRHDANLRAWLYTIAHRKATDVVRRAMRRPSSSLDGIDPAASPAPVAADDGLWADVRALPPKQAAAVVHRFVFDLAFAEIGQRMGTSEEAARRSVHEGLTKLRRRIPHDR